MRSFFVFAGNTGGEGVHRLGFNQGHSAAAEAAAGHSAANDTALGADGLRDVDYGVQLGAAYLVIVPQGEVAGIH